MQLENSTIYRRPQYRAIQVASSSDSDSEIGGTNIVQVGSAASLSRTLIDCINAPKSLPTYPSADACTAHPTVLPTTRQTTTDTHIMMAQTNARYDRLTAELQVQEPYHFSSPLWPQPSAICPGLCAVGDSQCQASSRFYRRCSLLPRNSLFSKH